MPTTKKCSIHDCEKNVAFAFNQLCTKHWDERIEQNIKKIKENLKK